MEYESNVLKRLIDTYGVIGNPKYMSEIIKQFIVQGKECFPHLFTYQADWLAHIDEFGLTSDYVVSYTGQQIYAPHSKEKPVKRAILKGSTKYRDIDTGEFLETFEEGRNLELVSVKTPVLTTVGKNLFDNAKFKSIRYINGSPTPVTDDAYSCYDTPISAKQGDTFTWSTSKSSYKVFIEFDDNDEQTSYTSLEVYTRTYTITNSKTRYIKLQTNNPISEYLETNPQLEKSSKQTTYEPHKSNILSVNEDVTLRSNGSVCDELDLLTGKLTQRIDEGGEILTQEVVRTVDLSIVDHDNQSINKLSTFEGGTHFTTSSQDGSLLPTLTVDVVTDFEETLMVCSLEGNTM